MKKLKETKQINDGEPICNTKGHHSLFSYEIKREDIRYFWNPNCK